MFYFFSKIKNISWILVGLVSGCAVFSDIHQSPWLQQTKPMPYFIAEGRLLIKNRQNHVYAHFEWQSYGTHQNIMFKTPLGNSVAQLCRDDLGVIAQGNGQIYQSDNLDELLKSSFNVELPLDNLSVWVYGRWVNHVEAQQKEGDLYQNGWQISRQSQPNQHDVPKLMLLHHDDINVRLVFDDFQIDSTTKQPLTPCSLRMR